MKIDAVNNSTWNVLSNVGRIIGEIFITIDDKYAIVSPKGEIPYTVELRNGIEYNDEWFKTLWEFCESRGKAHQILIFYGTNYKEVKR